MVIMNGRVSQQSSFSHVYRFRLTPKRTGKLVIPGPSASVDGKTISARALSLNVIAPEEQDLVVAELKTDRKRVYPTQPFEVTLRILCARCRTTMITTHWFRCVAVLRTSMSTGLICRRVLPEMRKASGSRNFSPRTAAGSH